MPRIYKYNTEAIDNLFSDHTIYENREKMAKFSTKEFKSEVTITIGMYKDLPKIKKCVNSVMKYTKNIDFDLIFLIDGSQEGIFDYYKNFEYEKTTIIYNTANRGGGVPWTFLSLDMLSEYVAILASDVIVTENWLNNLMTCIKSDPLIGMVSPLSSNSSNLQNYNLGGFSDDEEMQKKASAFNISDPTKWQERMRIVTIAPLVRKSTFYLRGFTDPGFSHNFGDDDMAFAIRRMGYKTIVAGDTWVHHDHSRMRMSEEECNSFNKNLSLGRTDFKTKYYGVDAWDDVNNYVMFKHLIENTTSNVPSILGIDVKCGTPILDVKNSIRKFNKYTTNCFAITSDAKYYMDLLTVCGAGQVVSGDVMQSIDKFLNGSIDYIFIDRYINQYCNPFELISKCATLLKNDGHIYVYLKNTYDILSYLEIIGYITNTATEASLNYTYSQFIRKVEDMGGNIKCIYTESYSIEELGNLLNIAENCLEKTLNPTNDPNDRVNKMIAKKWAFDITLK